MKNRGNKGGKMANTNPNTSICTLNVNDIILQLKGKDWQSR